MENLTVSHLLFSYLEILFMIGLTYKYLFFIVHGADPGE